MTRSTVYLGFTFILALGSSALAKPPEDIADLVGARGAGGETQMEARGYAHVRTSTVRDAKFSFWWNARRRVCASIATRDGRYATIDSVPSANCDQQGAAAAAADSAYPDHLMLICWGEGQKPSSEYRSGYEWDSKQRKYVRTGRVEQTTARFDAELLVEITGREGRIKLPRSLVPPINSGGARGNWWDLEELQVSPQTISGRYRLNGLNKPRVNIDRRIGRIRVDGLSHFTGSCEDAEKAGNNPRF